MEFYLSGNLPPSQVREKRYLSDMLPGWLLQLIFLLPVMYNLAVRANNLIARVSLPDPVTHADSSVYALLVVIGGLTIISFILAPILGFLIKIVGSLLLNNLVWRFPMPSWTLNVMSFGLRPETVLKRVLKGVDPTAEFPGRSQDWFLRRMVPRIMEVLAPALEREQLAYYLAGAYFARNLAFVGILWVVALLISFGIEWLWPFSNVARIALLHAILLLSIGLLLIARYCLEVLASRAMECLIVLINKDDQRKDVINAIKHSLSIASDKD